MKNVVQTIATNSAATEDYRELASSLFRNGFVSLADLTNPEDIRVIEEELLSLLEDLGDGKIDVRSLGDGSRAGAEARIVEIASPSALRPMGCGTDN
jgi:hypothetical protein